MAGVDTFGAVKVDIERALEDRINSLVERELNVSNVAAMLGTIQAIATVTAQIASNARQGLIVERVRDALQAKVATAPANEANELRESIDRANGRLAEILAQHQALAAHLETLDAALRA